MRSLTLSPRSLLAGLSFGFMFGSLCTTGCVGERPIAPLPPVDQPEVDLRCQGDQTNLVGDVVIRTPAELEAFVGCATILGNVTIETLDAADLSLLSSMRTIDGYLYIARSPSLTSLAGLEGLTRVARGISIEENAVLERVSLPALEEAQGNFIVSDNPVLVELDLGALTLVEPALVDVDGLGTLVAQGGALVLADNPALASLNGFESLQRIEGDLDIRGMDALDDLTGLDALLEIEGSISLGLTTNDRGEVLGSPNASLQSLNGLGALELLTGNLSIGFNPAMTTLAGLDSLEELDGDVTLFSNDILPSLSGLTVERMGGDLNLGLTFDFEGFVRFLGNGGLVELGSPNLVEIGGDLVAAGNPLLESMENLPELLTLGGDVLLLDNAELGDLELPPLLTIVPNNLVSGLVKNPDGTLSVFGNGTTSFGSPAYTEINGDLVLAGTTPSDLEAFEDLTRIGGTLRLVDTELESTTGMLNLTAAAALEIGTFFEAIVDGEQTVVEIGNDRLEIVEGFDLLTTVGALKIIGNPDLLDCTLVVNAVTGDLILADNGLETIALGPTTVVGGDVIVGAVPLGGDRRVSLVDDPLPTLSGLDLLTVGGSLIVESMPELATVDSAALTSVGGDVILTFLPALAAVDLDAVATVGGDFILKENPLLVSTVGFALLTSVGGDVEIARNIALDDLSFSGLASVGGDLRLSDLRATTVAFPVLTSTGGDFALELLDIANVDGFSAVSEVGGDLALLRNINLVELLGFAGLTSVGGNLIAQTNEALDESAIQVLFDALETEGALLTCGNIGDDAC